MTTADKCIWGIIGAALSRKRS